MTTRKRIGIGIGVGIGIAVGAAVVKSGRRGPLRTRLKDAIFKVVTRVHWRSSPARRGGSPAA